jgi:hypothetical protein
MNGLSWFWGSVLHRYSCFIDPIVIESVSASFVVRSAIVAQINCPILERLVQPYLMDMHQESKERIYSFPLSPRFSVAGSTAYPELHIPLELFGVECQLNFIKSAEENLFRMPTQTSQSLSASARDESDKKSTQAASFGMLDFIDRSCSLFPFW